MQSSTTASQPFATIGRRAILRRISPSIANGNAQICWKRARNFCPEATVSFLLRPTKVLRRHAESIALTRTGKKRWEIQAGHEYEPGISETMSIDSTTHSLFGVSKAAADLSCGRSTVAILECRRCRFRGGCLTGPRARGGPSCTDFLFLSHDLRREADARIRVFFGYKGKQCGATTFTAFDPGGKAFGRIHPRARRRRGEGFTISAESRPRELLHSGSDRFMRGGQWPKN